MYVFGLGEWFSECLASCYRSKTTSPATPLAAHYVSVGMQPVSRERTKIKLKNQRSRFQNEVTNFSFFESFAFWCKIYYIKLNITHYSSLIASRNIDWDREHAHMLLILNTALMYWISSGSHWCVCVTLSSPFLCMSFPSPVKHFVTNVLKSAILINVIIYYYYYLGLCD